MRFKKKPVVIDAERWMGPGTVAGIPASNPHIDNNWVCAQCKMPNETHGHIGTLEGWVKACVGDWIITGVKGERYPCKPDIFEQTYEPAT
jgi:hypothetical protein